MRQVDINLCNIYKIVKILKWQKPTKRYHLQSSPHIGNSDLAQVFSVGGLVQGVTYLLRWVESVFWTVLQDTFFLQWAFSYSHPGQVNIFQVWINYNLFRPQPRLSFVWLPDVHPWSGPHLLYDQDQHCPRQPHLWSGQSQIMKHFFRCKQLKVLEKNPLC